MKHNIYLLITLILICGLHTGLSAQGCVAVRQMGGINPLASNGYTLPKGQFQIGTSYRYFHSFRHFIGSVEQKQRQTTGGGFDENGKEKGNAVNIYAHAVDLNLSYGITDRIQVNVSIPYVNNERSQVLKTKTQTDPDTKETITLEGIRYSVYAKGLGDIRINSTYWIFDPKHTTNGNLLVGAGLKLNTGSHAEKDNGLALDDNGNVIKTSQTMDQAIQPGDGGIGFSVELQGFRKIYKSLYGFGNGYYLFNPRESNGTYKTTFKSAYDLYACPDQYFARAGVMATISNVTPSIAGRVEGIPAYDKFGGQVAYRRPGYVVAVEFGLSYRMGKHSVSLFLPYNFYKRRIQSAADIAQTIINDANTLADPVKYPAKKPVNGDAAFADYSISFNYSYRIGKLF